MLNLVSSTYRGNYTTSYAVNNDYSTLEKEIWINAKGYSSKTQYLIWVNRAYPHANVFQGSKGNWKLIKSFLVGIGAPSTPTPTGLTTISYKSAGGWTTSTYTVRYLRVSIRARAMRSTPACAIRARIPNMTSAPAIRSRTAACACIKTM